MKMYEVSTKEYQVNTRVQPLGSEHYEDINLLGIYSCRRAAYEGIKDFMRSISLAYVNQFVEDEFEVKNVSLGVINKIDDNTIELKYSDDLEDIVIFKIEEKEINLD